MVRKHLLENGATVLIDEMQDVRSFALGFFVRAGSGEETPEKRGISHFLEHVLFKRTRRRSTVEIARAIDRLGGDVDAFTTKEYTGFYAHTLDSRFSEAADLLGDIVLSPAFESDDIEALARQHPYYDPIDTLRTYMEQNGMGDEASFKNIDREIKDVINKAAEFAQSSPEPDPSELWTDVLIEA